MTSPEPQILVVGDLMLDRYTRGSVDRVSPEALVLVLRTDNQEDRLGGAASVARLLAGLGADVSVAGVVGGDAEGARLRELLEELEIETSLVRAQRNRPTTVKQRFLAGTEGRQPQQVLRVDRETTDPISGDPELPDSIAAVAAIYDAVLVSDYAKGVCTPSLLGHVISAAHAAETPVLVDPARISDYARYRGAEVIVPNRTEAARATGRRIDGVDEATVAGQQIRQLTSAKAVVVKLDCDGMVLVDSAGCRHLATVTREVCDVTGAGDTVLAVLGYGWATCLDLEEACRLANVAAGLQVERLGISPIGWQQIHRASRPGKTIALDFDGTYTADPELWRFFVRDALRAGHRVVVVSCRSETSENLGTIRQRLGTLGASVPIVLTSHRPKRMCAQFAGYDVDIWIDDQPGVIEAVDAGEVARIETR